MVTKNPELANLSLLLAHTGCPGKRTVKQLLLLVHGVIKTMS